MANLVGIIYVILSHRPGAFSSESSVGRLQSYIPTPNTAQLTVDDILMIVYPQRWRMNIMYLNCFLIIWLALIPRGSVVAISLSECAC